MDAMDLPIVIVYLGSHLPDYVIKNCRYLTNTFSEKQLILVTDHKHQKIKKVKNFNFKSILIEKDDSSIDFFQDYSGHPKDFRSGFWYLTIARFFALEFVMIKEGIDRAIHFESDVLVSPSFPFDSFIGHKVAFPTISANKAIASIFYVGSRGNLKNFNDFARSKIIEDPMETDMTLLSCYLNAFPDKAEDLNSQTSTSKSILFDGASFGMFLTGTDPRNTFGRSTLFGDIPDHDEKPSKFKYSFSKESDLLITEKDNVRKLVNLHIHSKSSRFFPESWPPKQLVRNVARSQKRATISVFYPLVFIELTCNFFARRSRILFQKRFF